MNFEDVVFPAPSGAASLTLNAPIARHADLTARVREVEQDRDDAGRAAQEASAALAELERRRAGGEPVDAAEIKRAEQTLAKARAAAHAPWGERQAGLRDAVRDAAAAIQRPPASTSTRS